MAENIHGPVRARDLRANIADMGFERGVTATLELLLEEHSENRERMRLLVQMVEGCINQVEMMVRVSTGMNDIIVNMQRILKPDGEHDN
jgi:hypothetical protein